MHLDDVEARLWEISENLHRAELTALERSEHLEEWRKLTVEKVNAQVAHLPHARGKPDKGHSATAKEFGTTREEVRRAEKIANITDDVEARLWEISENLHRAELTALERSEHLEEWRKLTVEKVNGQVAHLPHARGKPDKGHSATAKEFGTTREEVRRAEKIANITDDVEARLWEISENLHRAELTALERSEHLEEWRKLTVEKANAQVAHSAHTGGKPDKGHSATAKEFGTTREEVRRAEKIANITDDAKDAARAAGLANNQSALLQVARNGGS